MLIQLKFLYDFVAEVLNAQVSTPKDVVLYASVVSAYAVADADPFAPALEGE
jgi:hypothetical protein